MNIFKVQSNSVAFDEDESMIVVATCENRALKIAIDKWLFRDEDRKHNDFSVEQLETSNESILHVAHYGD